MLKKKRKRKSFSEGVNDKAGKFKEYFDTFQFELFTEETDLGHNTITFLYLEPKLNHAMGYIVCTV